MQKTLKNIILIFLVIISIGCKNKNSDKKLTITIVNNTEKKVCFDMPDRLLNVSGYDTKISVFFINQEIDAVERIRQFDEKHGSRTMFNKFPEATLIEMKQGETKNFFVETGKQLPNDNDYALCFFYMVNTDDKIDLERYDFDYYVDSMLSYGYLSIGDYDDRTMTFYLNDRIDKKITSEAVTDFPNFFENCYYIISRKFLNVMLEAGIRQEKTWSFWL